MYSKNRCYCWCACYSVSGVNREGSASNVGHANELISQGKMPADGFLLHKAQRVQGDCEIYNLRVHV